MGRLFKAALICACLALALPGAAAATLRESASAPSAADHTATAFRPLGHTVLATIASTTGADEALTALGESLAMSEAQRRIEANPAPDVVSRVVPPRGGKKLETSQGAEEIVPGDPSTMPPASAGSNGTAIDHHSSSEREKIFANMHAGGGESTSILLTGIALPPPDAPEAVQAVIDNANTIVGRPYIWGGGHGSFYSYGYDCSGSVSFALFGAGLIPEPLTSGSLEGWAKRAGLSERTLVRLISRETGMSFGRWRQQLGVMLAVQWLAGGASTQQVAADLGYESVPSFVTMFRKTLGTSPGRYMAERHSGRHASS